MGWFSGKTAIAGSEISNWALALALLTAVLIIYKVIVLMHLDRQPTYPPKPCVIAPCFTFTVPPSVGFRLTESS
jgi:hypothetical protein